MFVSNIYYVLHLFYVFDIFSVTFEYFVRYLSLIFLLNIDSESKKKLYRTHDQ